MSNCVDKLKILTLSFATITLYGTPSTAATVRPAAGGVYTESNGVDGNIVLAYQRGWTGALKFIGTYETGGRGSGGTIDPLQSQGAVLLSADHHWLFAVNSGTGDVTSFEVRDDASLRRVDKKPSGGGFPVALAVHGNVLYVLNSGGAGSVSGFWILPNGRLRPIPGSTQLLSSASAGGSSLSFSPDGSILAATERLTNRIDLFPIDSNGVAGPPFVNASNGAVPFAVSYTPQNALIVAEAAGNPAGGSAVSSYTVTAWDALNTVTASLPTGFKAACWLETTSNGAYAYMANAGSNEITIDDIAADGTLSTTSADTTGATSADAVGTGAGTIPLDIALTGDDRYLYALEVGSGANKGGPGAIAGFAIQKDGSLLSIGSIPSLPAQSGQNGLAAY